VLSLEDVAHLVEQRARANRPDLQDDVCKAIGSYFAYSYK